MKRIKIVPIIDAVLTVFFIAVSVAAFAGIAALCVLSANLNR